MWIVPGQVACLLQESLQDERSAEAAAMDAEDSDTAAALSAEAKAVLMLIMTCIICHLSSPGELDEATGAEAAAVEAEDFERAAALSAQADAAKARLADLQQAVRAADSTCERLVHLCLNLVIASWCYLYPASDCPVYIPRVTLMRAE